MFRKGAEILLIVLILTQLTACVHKEALINDPESDPVISQPVQTLDPTPTKPLDPTENEPPSIESEPVSGEATTTEPILPGPLPSGDLLQETETFSTLEIFMNGGLNIGEEEIIIENEADLEKYRKAIEDIIKKAEEKEVHKYNEHEWVYTGDSERHPHYKEYKCACGATLVTGETADYEMKIIGPSKEHPHYMLEECSICGGQFPNSDMPTTLTWILHGYTADHPHYMITKCSQCDYTEVNQSVTALDNGACNLVYESDTATHPHYRIISCDFEGCTYSKIDETHTGEWEIEIDDENNYSVAHPHYLFGLCNYDGCDHVEQTNQTADWTWEDGICSICGQHKKMLYTQTPTGKAITGVQEDFADSHYDIPSTIGNEPVTEIWSRAFAGLPILQSVVIPEGVRLIGDGAFTDCPELSAVTIPPSVYIIEDRAFASCPKLKEVEINTLVAPAITAEVFAGCHPDLIIYAPEGAEGFQIGPWEELPVVWR